MNHPKLIEGNRALDKALEEQAEQRSAREALSKDFALIEGEIAAANEKLRALRRSLDLNRKKGRGIQERIDEAKADIRATQAQIDAAFGGKIVTVEIVGRKYENQTAREIGRAVNMTVQAVIEAAGGTILWDDFSVSVPDSKQ